MHAVLHYSEVAYMEREKIEMETHHCAAMENISLAH